MNDRHLRPVDARDERHASVCVAASSGDCDDSVPQSYVRARRGTEKFDVYLTACGYHFAAFGFGEMGFVAADLPGQ